MPDYVVLHSGELELGLSDSTWKTFRPGDLLINVGAAHAWRNKTDKWPRGSHSLLRSIEDSHETGQVFFVSLRRVSRRW